MTAISSPQTYNHYTLQKPKTISSLEINTTWTRKYILNYFIFPQCIEHFGGVVFTLVSYSKNQPTLQAFLWFSSVPLVNASNLSISGFFNIYSRTASQMYSCCFTLKTLTCWYLLSIYRTNPNLSVGSHTPWLDISAKMHLWHLLRYRKSPVP